MATASSTDRAAYAAFFEALTGHPPYPFQEELALSPWPHLLDVPTGLGKTAAIVVAWLWKLRRGDPETPRRLVYCLPMRVLVEQTARNAREWVEEARDALDDAGAVPPEVAILMGGEVEVEWVREPERPALVVGTQDMLLSRALDRGYGMSPFQWPVHFALLHNDAFWVYDEVQLMGPAVATSAQLEAFRRALGTAAPSRSLWASATLDRRWLATVDLAADVPDLGQLRLGERDRAVDRVRHLLTARKRLVRSAATLDKKSAQRGGRAYLADLSAEILAHHRPGSNTLVILNRVERAQGLYGKLQGELAADGPDTLLIHGRFRPAERSALEAGLRKEPPEAGRIIVSTQVVEAGVDLTSATLFTELCPWPSFVQRCGRCNRRGEEAEGQVRWIDVDEGQGDLPLPYEAELLHAARAQLEELDDVGLDHLPRFEAPPPAGLVLRRRDLLELFNTDPDLFGFHVDVSPYIRDGDDRSLQVYWRELPDDRPSPELDAPIRDELCPASIAATRTALGKRRRGWQWDAQDGRWRRVARNDLRPGMVLLLPSRAGGYDEELGFLPAARETVPEVPRQEAGPNDDIPSDTASRSGRWVGLAEHLAHVADLAGELAARVRLPAEELRALVAGARWHDVGKAHPAFQEKLLRRLPDGDPQRSTLWAKSGPLPPERVAGDADGAGRGGTADRRYYRHELASALAWLAHSEDHPERDLVAYLIAAHHGKVRTSLRALPAEPAPEDRRRHARGVWEGDELPAVEIPGERVPRTTLSLAVMELGEGPHGPSWSARVHELLAVRGPFRLAWLEALLRIADWRASAMEEEEVEG